MNRGGCGVNRSSRNSVYSHFYIIPNHKTNKKKKDISKQLSKVVKEVKRNYKMFANPVFITPGRFMG